MSLQFNPDLDLENLKHAYSADNRTRISNIWPEATAQEIASALAADTQFTHAYHLNGRSVESTDAELKSMVQTERQKLISAVHQNAAKGVGFLYGRHMIGPDNKLTSQLLKDVHTYMNQNEVIDKIRYITGHQDIKLASAQATRYIPGNFLTRHNDVVEAEGRKVAYVLSFTPRWHPDWGGLLQFFQNDGTPKDAWSPQFNSITLFDVRHVHSVTYVAPFAPTPRLSITGWFRTK